MFYKLGSLKLTAFTGDVGSTVRIGAGGDIENRLPGGNDEK